MPTSTWVVCIYLNSLWSNQITGLCPWRWKSQFTKPNSHLWYPRRHWINLQSIHHPLLLCTHQRDSGAPITAHYQSWCDNVKLTRNTVNSTFNFQMSKSSPKLGERCHTRKQYIHHPAKVEYGRPLTEHKVTLSSYVNMWSNIFSSTLNLTFKL